MAEFGLPEQPKSGVVPRERVISWMEADDLEVLGAVYNYITNKEYAHRIQPSLALAECLEFMMKYYERCFRENPRSSWAHARYEAGWELVNWFKSLWNDKTVERGVLHGLKDWLASVYRSADTELRQCIVTATLEHLFEDRKILRFFSDWQKDPVLASAYRDAVEWVQNGGVTPLGSGVQ